MHILPPAVRAPSENMAKRLSPDFDNAPVYDQKPDNKLAARQTNVVVITGADFTITLDGPLSLTLPADNPPVTTTVDSPPLPTTSSDPTVAETTPEPPIVSVTSTVVPVPVASAVNSAKSSKASNAKNTMNAQENNAPVGATSAKSGGLPTGAIVGIALVVVVLILGGFVFLVRQRALRQRKLQRATQTWATGAAGFAQPPPQPAGSFSGAGANPTPAAAEGGYGMGMGEQSPGVSFARAQAAALASRPTLAPPPSAYGSAAAPSYGAPIPSGPTATVRYEFIPSLPDELSIVTGEIVRIVSEFDDGWALCANGNGQQGMVPVECLDRNDAGAPNMQGGNRNSRRGSSLGARY